MFPRHLEPQLPSGEGQAVDPLRGVLVAGAGILGQKGQGRLPMLRGEALQEILGKVHQKGPFLLL